MILHVLFFVCSLFVLAPLAGQSPKIGFTNAEYILSLLPESKQMESDITSYEKQLENQIKAKYDDLQNKLSEYQNNEESYNDLIKRDKQEEINSMQESLQKFSVEAERSLGEKREKVLGPAVEKIGNAIRTAAEDNGYDFIFSAGSPGVDVLLYATENADVTNLVLKKLGITPPPRP